MSEDAKLIRGIWPVWLVLIGLVFYVDRQGWIPDQSLPYGLTLRSLLILGSVAVYPLVFSTVYYLDAKEERGSV